MKKDYIKKYAFIYKTTCLVSGKIYIGQHQTNNLNDGYLGSGTLFKKDVITFGVQNFKREILEFCSDASSLHKSERRWISIFNAIDSVIGYNQQSGGGVRSLEVRIKISESHRGNRENREIKKRRSLGHKRGICLKFKPVVIKCYLESL